MRVIEHKKQLPETEIRCPRCKALLAYTSTDVWVHWHPWQRTGVESSKRNGYTYVVCLECSNQIILKEITEEY